MANKHVWGEGNITVSTKRIIVHLDNIRLLNNINIEYCRQRKNGNQN